MQHSGKTRSSTRSATARATKRSIVSKLAAGSPATLSNWTDAARSRRDGGRVSFMSNTQPVSCQQVRRQGTNLRRAGKGSHTFMKTYNVGIVGYGWVAGAHIAAIN